MINRRFLNFSKPIWKLKHEGLFYKFRRIGVCDNSLKLLYSVRSSRPEVFLGKVVLKIGSNFTGEHPCRSAILFLFPMVNALNITVNIFLRIQTEWRNGLFIGKRVPLLNEQERLFLCGIKKNVVLLSIFFNEKQAQHAWFITKTIWFYTQL